MKSPYGSVEVPQSTSRVLRWLFRHLNRSRNAVVSTLMPTGEALLELGSGEGHFCAKHYHAFKRVVGLDLSSDRVQRAVERYRDTPCTFLQQDLNKPLPFADQSFDVVVSIATLDWVYDLAGCLKEVHRVLKPTGTVILQVNNLGYFVRRIKLLFGVYPNASVFVKSAWPMIGWDASICHYFTKKELSEYLAQLGFTVKKVTGSGLLYKVSNWLPALLCGDLILICQKKN